MEGKQKRSFLDRLLYEDPEDGEQSSQVDGGGNSSSPKSSAQLHVAETPNSDSTSAYVGMFRDAIRDSNEIGQRFIQVLYTLSTDPKESHYEQAFQLLKIMSPTLASSDIKTSLERLIAFVEKETESYTNQGNAKKAKLESQQQSEESGLRSDIARIQTELDTLQRNLKAKQSELSEKQTSLNAVGGKYQPQIDDVRKTLAAINAASDETRSSLTQFLTGVKNYLKGPKKN